MTPEQKFAEDLINQFSYSCRECNVEENPILFSIFCIDEIIKAIKKLGISKSNIVFYIDVKEILREKLK